MNSNAGRQLISTIKQRWREGETPDANAALNAHPQLRDVKSLALDLAYEEFCQRVTAGEQINPVAFCQRFSRYRSSLACRLEVHQLLDENPDLLGDLDSRIWPEVGDTTCGFKLIAELGRGMIGRVFLAEEVALADRKVAVKFTWAGVREAETLSRLQHPSIVPVYSVSKEPLSGLAAICMPYRGRHTLQDFVDAAIEDGSPPHDASEVLERLGLTPLSHNARLSYVHSTVRLAVTMCEALAHTHSKGILHLDLKPSNILLTEQGEPLLLDFNLSLTDDSRRSLIGGTMPYMSPDQIKVLVLGAGTEEELDARSDVFSLGVILYQLLTGRHPFAGVHWQASPEQVGKSLLELQHRGATPAVILDRRVGSGLSRVLEKALAVNIDARYSSMEEFGADLRRELGLSARWQRYRQNHRRLLLLAACFFMLCFIAIGTAVALREPFEIRETRRAWQLRDEGKDREAARVFTTVIDANDGYHDAYFGRGRARQRLSLFNEAYTDFTRAYQLHPDGRYAACRGFAAAAEGKEDVAIARYEEALRAGFDSKELQLCLGGAYARRNLLGPAEQHLRRALEFKPDYTAAWQQLALAFRRKDPAKAHECIDNAIAGDDPQPSTFADAAVIVWTEKNAAGAAEIRQYLRAGAEIGLSWEECQKLGYLVPSIEDDPQLVQRLKDNPAQPSIGLRRDPLGDPAISQAFFRKPTQP